MGTVVEVTGAGDKTVAVVDFGSEGTKSLLMRYAPIEEALRRAARIASGMHRGSLTSHRPLQRPREHETPLHPLVVRGADSFTSETRRISCLFLVAALITEAECVRRRPVTLVDLVRDLSPVAWLRPHQRQLVQALFTVLLNLLVVANGVLGLVCEISESHSCTS